jgi:hypothetical protein
MYFNIQKVLGRYLVSQMNFCDMEVSPVVRIIGKMEEEGLMKEKT